MCVCVTHQSQPHTCIYHNPTPLVHNNIHNNNRLRRAALQLLGVVVDVEGPRCTRRVPDLLPLILPVLAQAADTMDATLTPQQAEQQLQQCPTDASTPDHDPTPGSQGGAAWQQVYYACRLLEKLLPHSTNHLAWESGDAAQLLWETVCALQLYPHVWIRVVAARLLKWALGAPSVGPPMLRGTQGLAGRLAWQLVKQLEAPVLDDVMGALSVGNMTLLAPLLYEQDAQLGRLPVGDGEEEDTEDKEEGRTTQLHVEEGNKEEDQGGAHQQHHGVSLLWVAHKISQLAGLHAQESQVARLHALDLCGSLTVSLGPVRCLPLLPVLLKPLYRLEEGVGPAAGGEVAGKADEVMATIRYVGEWVGGWVCVWVCGCMCVGVGCGWACGCLGMWVGVGMWVAAVLHHMYMSIHTHTCQYTHNHCQHTTGRWWVQI